MKDTYTWGEYVVASIDVMGQKCQFERIKDFIIDDIPQAILDEVAHKTIRPVEFVRNKLEELFLESQKVLEPRIAISEEERAEYDRSRVTTPIRFQYYSDSILAYIALRTTGYQMNDLWAVRDMFISIGGTLLMTFILNASFRTAIELGTGSDLETGDLYGPIRAEVNNLENKVADYPRVIVGDRLFEYLRSFYEMRPRIPCKTERESCGSREAATVCLKMISDDPNDGLRILDYLGNEFTERTKCACQGETHRDAWEFVVREFAKHVASRNDKVAEKFRKLSRYFRSRLPMAL